MSLAHSIATKIPALPRADQASRLRDLVQAVAGERPTLDAEHPAPVPHRPAASPAPVIAIASGKGGVGKSNVAVNLAIAMTRRYVRCTLLDADMGVANADVLCGLNPAVRLDRAMATGGDLGSITVDAPGGFRLVPGAVGLARLADLGAHDRQWLIDRLIDLEAGSDAVIIDTPAGVGSIVMAMTSTADLTLVVCTPEPTSIADAYALLKCLAAERHVRRTGLPLRVGLIVNQAMHAGEAHQVHHRVDNVTQRFLSWKIPFVGWVPIDSAVPEAVRARRPFMIGSPNAPASGAMTRVAESVCTSLRLGDPGALSIAERLTLLGRLRQRLRKVRLRA